MQEPGIRGVFYCWFMAEKGDKNLFEMYKKSIEDRAKLLSGGEGGQGLSSFFTTLPK